MSLTLHFGLQLDDHYYLQLPDYSGGIFIAGPHKLLGILEIFLGLGGHQADNEHLRIEQFRQALAFQLSKTPAAFYRASFEADQMATAVSLLAARDELLLAGWDFVQRDNMPERLATLATIHHHLLASENDLFLSPGYADRYIEVLQGVDQKDNPFRTVYIREPFTSLPAHLQRLFGLFEKKGCALKFVELPEIKEQQSDLAVYQRILREGRVGKEKLKLKGDGSLLILRSERETESAAYLAHLFEKNKSFRPICLVPEKNRALDNALIQQGLPSLGILSASLARPSLQILKLISAFLWEPVDPFKLMEFVSLPLKPLANDLARIIAAQLAQTPGIKSDNWNIAIRRYFDELEKKAATDPNLDFNQIQRQYQFWFERRRYPIGGTVPKQDVVRLFTFLEEWAFRTFESEGSKNKSMLVLSQQAHRVRDLLEALPKNETVLSALELERIVRTIYEPSPVLFREQEAGHLPFVHHNAAILSPAKQVLWWNFVRNEPDHFFSRWYRPELAYLENAGIHLFGPREQNALLVWRRKLPVLMAEEQLVFILPERVDGKEVWPHPLHDELEACFDDLSPIIHRLQDPQLQAMEPHFVLPGYVKLKAQQLGRPRPFLTLKRPEKMGPNETETFTSLDALFYYPYQWVFRYKIRLRKSSILSVVKDNTLMGNLSHRFFEMMLREDFNDWKKSDVNQWIDREAPQLLRREGAVLLMYGREPERVSFINRIKYAAWSLVSLIRNNGWKVVQTEKELNGVFQYVPLRAKADLVLARNQELAVVDLKWRGIRRREAMIRNEEDLQLAMYARLLTNDDAWAHTAYFLIEDGKMIARNQEAFNECQAVSAEADHAETYERIWSKMERTFDWRMEQLKTGKIEVRTKQTFEDIELENQGEMMDLLEMKNEDAFFDDYRTLINLVD